MGECSFFPFLFRFTRIARLSGLLVKPSMRAGPTRRRQHHGEALAFPPYWCRTAFYQMVAKIVSSVFNPFFYVFSLPFLRWQELGDWATGFANSSPNWLRAIACWVPFSEF